MISAETPSRSCSARRASGSQPPRCQFEVGNLPGIQTHNACHGGVIGAVEAVLQGAAIAVLTNAVAITVDITGLIQDAVAFSGIEGDILNIAVVPISHRSRYNRP